MNRNKIIAVIIIVFLIISLVAVASFIMNSSSGLTSKTIVEDNGDTSNKITTVTTSTTVKKFTQTTTVTKTPTTTIQSTTAKTTNSPYDLVKNLASWSTPTTSTFEWRDCSNNPTTYSLSGNYIKTDFISADLNIQDKIVSNLVKDGWVVNSCNNISSKYQIAYTNPERRAIIIITPDTEAPETPVTKQKFEIYYE